MTARKIFYEDEPYTPYIFGSGAEKGGREVVDFNAK